MPSAENRNPVLLKFFSRYLDDRNPARFIMDVAKCYRVPTLQRVATAGRVVERRAALMALSFLGGYECNAVFARSLHDDDRGVRMLAEDAICDIWCRAGNKADQYRLNQVKRYNDGAMFNQASDLAAESCDRSPFYAEAWNQLGIAQFFTGRIEDSIQSCWKVLTLNPYQYEAALGLGHAYLEVDEPLSAMESFQHALELNPNLETVRMQVAKLQRSFKQF